MNHGHYLVALLDRSRILHRARVADGAVRRECVHFAEERNRCGVTNEDEILITWGEKARTATILGVARPS
jgi:hypothetical protein